jgi:hypothetical protein
MLACTHVSESIFEHYWNDFWHEWSPLYWRLSGRPDRVRSTRTFISRVRFRMKDSFWALRNSLITHVARFNVKLIKRERNNSSFCWNLAILNGWTTFNDGGVTGWSCHSTQHQPCADIVSFFEKGKNAIEVKISTHKKCWSAIRRVCRWYWMWKLVLVEGCWKSLGFFG